MTIVVTGGGSGGHITPLLAIASEIKKAAPDTRIVYIGQRGDRFAKVVASHPAIDSTSYIFAGKFRRYHGEGLRQLLDIKTVLLNIRDMFLISIGILQSLVLVRKMKPSKVFIKGGFVGVPVGLASAFWRIPYITHDSDALAGLANRLIARWASLHAVALPKEVYDYPQHKTVTVGVPTAEEYVRVTPDIRVQYKHDLSLPANAEVLTVTGGGLGAQSINQAMLKIMPQLLHEFPNLHVFHFTGQKHEKQMNVAYKALPDESAERVRAIGFTSELYKYTGAANVAVVRAGATNMAEMAIQGIACIIIPNPVLTGGHQLKNAKAYEDRNAVVVVSEQSLADAQDLHTQIRSLLTDQARQQRLGNALHEFAYANSAKRVSELLLADDVTLSVD